LIVWSTHAWFAMSQNCPSGQESSEVQPFFSPTMHAPETQRSPSEQSRFDTHAPFEVLPPLHAVAAIERAQAKTSSSASLDPGARIM
jgi:hypothetical protein